MEVKTVQLIIVAASVAGANIALNYFTSRTASEAASLFEIFKTGGFWIAFAVGTTSLILMCTLYYLGRENSFGMANGILLMGAISIVGGSLYGYLGRGNHLHWSEWALLIVIACFITVRYWLSVSRM